MLPKHSLTIWDHTSNLMYFGGDEFFLCLPLVLLFLSLSLNVFDTWVVSLKWTNPNSNSFLQWKLFCWSWHSLEIFHWNFVQHSTFSMTARYLVVCCYCVVVVVTAKYAVTLHRIPNKWQMPLMKLECWTCFRIASENIKYFDSTYNVSKAIFYSLSVLQNYIKFFTL